MIDRVKRYEEILDKLDKIETNDVLVDIELTNIKEKVQKKLSKAKLDNLLGGVLNVYELEEVRRD